MLHNILIIDQILNNIIYSAVIELRYFLFVPFTSFPFSKENKHEKKQIITPFGVLSDI